MIHLEPRVEGILFQITERDAIVKTATLFSLVLAFIPVLAVLTWRLGRIKTLRRQIISGVLILFFMTLGAFARHQEVKMFFTKVVRPAVLVNGTTSIIYPIDPVNFVYYILGGLVAGCVLSFVLFRERKKKNKKSK
ncbi:MAG: hypothetical protein J7539_18945 [Niabella sp.]|nr:hypothetical protein [Niabella sp.]